MMDANTQPPNPASLVACPACGGPLVLTRSWDPKLPSVLVCQDCGKRYGEEEKRT